MRASSLILLFTYGAIGAVLLGAVILERGLFSFDWLLDENELPLAIDRKIPPGFVSKCLLWIQLFFDPANESSSQCQVYMAESTIPNAGMGIFTATNLEERAALTSGEIVIPITFPREIKGLWKVWTYYVWEPNIPQIDATLNQHAAFIPGVGATLNSHFWDLTNLYAVGKAQYDSLDRIKDVGAGAFTPYRKAVTHAHRPISAGSELFSFYGDNFFHSPLRLEMHATALKEADQMIIKFNNFVNEHPKLTSKLKEAIWKDLIQEFPISDINSGYEGVKALPQQKWRSLTRDRSLVGSPSWSRDVARRQHQHTPEWLQENGFCMDWIEEGTSTIHQAGRGAFAKRFIRKGTRIAMSPLVHIADKEAADGWGHDHVKQEMVRNYSFGHKETSLMLTPHGAGVGLINHSRDTNVKLQWPTELLPCHDPIYLEAPVTVLGHEKRPRLSLEYIVTRNVYPGEELFLNYGPEWEDAWESHIRKWRPQTEWFVHPSQVNKNEPIRTVQELRYDPYPPNLFLHCAASYALDEDDETNIYAPHATTVEWVPCEVISRNAWVYQVQLTESGIVVDKVPHNAIVFETLVAKSDWALPEAFRHEMTLPDELIPEVWKDKLL